MRMLYWPLRSPTSFSSRLPGGIRRSSTVSVASRRSNVRKAARRICRENFDLPTRLNRRSDSLSWKWRIIVNYSVNSMFMVSHIARLPLPPRVDRHFRHYLLPVLLYRLNHDLQSLLLEGRVLQAFFRFVGANVLDLNFRVLRHGEVAVFVIDGECDDALFRVDALEFAFDFRGLEGAGEDYNGDKGSGKGSDHDWLL